MVTKLRSETKETTLRVGHFTTGSGHIFANYINNFHKTEDLTVILTCTTLKNLHQIKSYDIKHILFSFQFFAIL